MKNIIKKIKSYQVFIIALFIIGTFFRAFMPQLYIFGFDQVQILTNAEAIVRGNITLIGPRTGPAEMFTGPLVYYITAFFLFFINSPWAVVGMSTVISLGTAFAIYFLSKRYLSIKSAVMMLSIWTFSPFLIHFDRIAWNPNLSLLASSLVFFPILGIVKQSKVKNTDLFFIALGSFLGFQAHFSGLLLPFMLFITLLLFKKLSIKPLLASALGILSSILPTLLFDARHGWINVRGLINFLSEEEAVGSTLFFERFTHSIKTGLEILGSLVPFQLEREVSIYLGLLLITILIWQLLKNKIENRTNTLISLFWTVTIIMIFSLYRSKSPEYYFFIFLPAMFVFVSDIFTPLLKKKNIQKDLLVLSITVLSLYTVSNFNSIAGKNSLNINNQLNLATDISRFSNKNELAKIAYDIQPVDSLGMRYFIDKNIHFSENGKTVHITHTNQENSRYGNYGLWVDPRTDLNNNYIVSDNKVLTTAQNTHLFEDHYLGDKFSSHKVFQVVEDDNFSEDTLVIVNNISNPFVTGNGTYREINNHVSGERLKDGWQAVSYEEYNGFTINYDSFLLVYNTQKTATEFLESNNIFSVISIEPGVLK